MSPKMNPSASTQSKKPQEKEVFEHKVKLKFFLHLHNFESIRSSQSGLEKNEAVITKAEEMAQNIKSGIIPVSEDSQIGIWWCWGKKE